MSADKINAGHDYLPKQKADESGAFSTLREQLAVVIVFGDVAERLGWPVLVLARGARRARPRRSDRRWTCIIEWVCKCV